MCQSCNGINSAKHQRLSKRYKLWQLPTYTHCPVIGTCLTLDELVKVVRQTGLLVEQGSDYYLHSSLVQLADQNVPPSRRIQKILDSKYSRWIKSYGALTTDAERKSSGMMLSRQDKYREPSGPLSATLTPLPA